MLPLLLASSSVYRRDLLSRLRLPFTCSSPDIDEGHHQGETAIELVKRLSLEKARALEAIEVALKRGGGRLNVYVANEPAARVEYNDIATNSIANHTRFAQRAV